MNLQISFIETRSRRKDPVSSKIAAANAANTKSAIMRRLIVRALKFFGPMTGRELSVVLEKPYHDVQRRLSECANIRKTDEMFEGGLRWEWCGSTPLHKD